MSDLTDRAAGLISAHNERQRTTTCQLLMHTSAGYICVVAEHADDGSGVITHTFTMPEDVTGTVTFESGCDPVAEAILS
jgi:hypothetical protein